MWATNTVVPQPPLSDAHRILCMKAKKKNFDVVHSFPSLTPWALAFFQAYIHTVITLLPHSGARERKLSSFSSPFLFASKCDLPKLRFSLSLTFLLFTPHTLVRSALQRIHLQGYLERESEKNMWIHFSGGWCWWCGRVYAVESFLHSNHQPFYDCLCHCSLNPYQKLLNIPCARVCGLDTSMHMCAIDDFMHNWPF